MIPAPLQMPAAIVLVLGGLLACFAGYRVFRIVLGIYGFILGALLASSLMSAEATLWIIGAALIGGIIGALILILAYFVGVALIGAGLGALLANVIWAAIGTEPHIAILILFAIVGALIALALQRYVIIVATAFGGAWTTIVGALRLTGAGAETEAAAGSGVWLVYPLSPAPGHPWVPAAWVVLGIAGIVVQLAFTAKPRPGEPMGTVNR